MVVVIIPTRFIKKKFFALSIFIFFCFKEFLLELARLFPLSKVSFDACFTDFVSRFFKISFINFFISFSNKADLLFYIAIGVYSSSHSPD